MERLFVLLSAAFETVVVIEDIHLRVIGINKTLSYSFVAERQILAPEWI